MSMLLARGGHGRRGPTMHQRGGDGHKLDRRVRSVRDDRLPRWQEPGGLAAGRDQALNLSRAFSFRSHILICAA
jgi:hypothetical protein